MSIELVSQVSQVSPWSKAPPAPQWGVFKV